MEQKDENKCEICCWERENPHRCNSCCKCGTRISSPKKPEWEDFEKTNPRATLLDGSLFYHEQDIKEFLKSHQEALVEKINELRVKSTDFNWSQEVKSAYGIALDDIINLINDL